MELSGFIRDAMTELVRGVKLANEAIRKELNGGGQNYVSMQPTEAGQPGGWVHFDVAVEPGKKGAVEVLQAEAGRSVSPATVSRMGFYVKLTFSIS